MPAALDIPGAVHGAQEKRLASAEGALDALIVEIAGQRYGLPAADVCELLRAAAIAPVAHAPAIEGLVNLHGAVAPVLDLRALLHLPLKPIEPSDHFVVIGIGLRRAVVRVDRTIDLVHLGPEDLERPGNGIPGDCVAHLAKRPGTLVPILDLAAILKRAWQPAPEGAAAAIEQAFSKEALG